MKIKSYLIGTMMVLMTMCGMLTSCSGDADVLSRVPDDVVMAGRFNATSVLDKLQVQFEDTTMVLPEYMGKSGLSNKDLREIALINKSVRLDRVYMFVIDYDTPLFAEEITDADALESALGEFKKKEVEGKTVYQDNEGTCFIIDGKILWINLGSSPELAVKNLGELNEKAKDAPLSKVRAVTDAFDREEIGTVCLNYCEYLKFMAKRTGMMTPAIPDMLKNSWGIMDLDTKDNSMICKYSILQPDGGYIEMGNMSEINTSVFNYVPDYFNFVCAAGTMDKEYMTSYYEKMDSTMNTNPQLGQLFKIARPYLESIDGTTLFAAGARDLSFYQRPDLYNWDILFMVHMSQEKTNEIVSFMTAQLPQLGINPIFEVSEGLFKGTYLNRDFYFGTVDGYLTLSTVEPGNNNTNHLAKYLQGHSFGCALEIPALNELSPSLPAWTPRFVAVNEQALSGRGELTLEGCNEEFILSIAKLICSNAK